jgi:hypothetical protein
LDPLLDESGDLGSSSGVGGCDIAPKRQLTLTDQTIVLASWQENGECNRSRLQAGNVPSEAFNRYCAVPVLADCLSRSLSNADTA